VDMTDTAATTIPCEESATGDLKRVLGLKSLIAVGVGLVVSQGIMALMLQGVGTAGIGFIIPLTIAFILALTYVTSFAELSLMFPKAGGFSKYTEIAIGHFPALLGTYSGYVVVAMFALPTELLLVDLLIGSVYPDLFPPMLLGGGVLILFTLLNIVGVDVFAKAQTFLAFTMIVALTLLGLAALTGSSAGAIETKAIWAEWNPTGFGVFALVTLAIWGFVGAEFICPMAEECKAPEKNIPRSMFFSVTIIFAVFVVYCMGALYYVPAAELIDNPLPHLKYAVAVFGDFGLLFIAVAGLTAVCSTVNTTLAAVPRMLYGMAQNGQALPVFSRVHRRFNTPWIAILFMALLVGIPMTLMSGADISQMLISAALCWLLAYLIAHVNVVVLRRRYPRLSRPFKSPFYPWPQLIGSVGILYALFHASPSAEMTLVIYGNAGAVLSLVAIASYFWVKFVMKKKLFSPSPVEKESQ